MLNIHEPKIIEMNRRWARQKDVNAPLHGERMHQDVMVVGVFEVWPRWKRLLYFISGGSSRWLPSRLTW